MSNNLQNINTLTGLRFVLAYWVCIYHVREALDVPVLSAIVNKGYLAVDGFFILSGYIMAYVYSGWFESGLSTTRFRSFILRRVARIYPLHLATLAGAVFTVFLLKQYAEPDKALYFDHIPYHLLMIHAWGLTDSIRLNFPSWSISAEWFAYLVLFPLGILIYRKLGMVGLIIITLLLCAGFIGVTIMHFDGHVGNVLQHGFLRIIPEFLLGIVAYRIVDLNSTLKRVIFLITILLAGIVATVWLSNVEYMLIATIVPVIVLLHVYQSSFQPIFVNRVMVWLGEISYSVYMVHFFSRITNGIIHHRIAGSESNSWLYFVNYTLLTLVFASISYYLIERPTRKLITLKYDLRS